MIYLELVNEKTLPEYEEFIKTSQKGHFMQSYAWGKFKDNWKFEAVIKRDVNGKIIASVAVLIRKLPGIPYTIMYAPRGPVCDIHDKGLVSGLLEDLKTLAKKHKSYVLKIDPDVSIKDEKFFEMVKDLGFRINASRKNFEGIQPRFVFRLDIEGKDQDETMQIFGSKTRYNIRLAQKKGVQVKLCGLDMVEKFHEIMLTTGIRDGFVIRNKEYFSKMIKELNGEARLYMAFFGGEPIAGSLAVHYGDKVWYLYGASANEYRNVMPNYLLQWEMIKWAIDEKCRIYDFRGVSGDLDESNPLYGLYRFKRGFNGEFVEFIGELDYLFKPAVFYGVKYGERAFRSVRKKIFMLKNKK